MRKILELQGKIRGKYVEKMGDIGEKHQVKDAVKVGETGVIFGRNRGKTWGKCRELGGIRVLSGGK